MIKSTKKIRIYWNDAVIYNKHESPLDIEPSKKIVEGELIKDIEKYDEYSDFVTIAVDKNSKPPNVPEDDITFFSIPKGMISKIEEIGENKNK